MVPKTLRNPKAFAPMASPLVRKRLLDRLDEGLGKKLCLIAAPAGYGKTTVLEQWQQRLTKSSYAVVRIKLGEAENEPLSFLSNIFKALESCGVRLENILSSSGRSMYGESLQSAVKYLSNALGKNAQDIILIFDGFEKIKDKQVLNLQQQMLHYFPPTIHFVVSGREIPPIRLSDLKLRNDVMILSAQELKFSAEDIRRLFIDEGHQGKAESISDMLFQKTEGWIAAIEMAIHWMQDKPDRLAAIETFSGRTLDLAEYLLEQVLEDQPEDIKTALMRMAIFERFNGELLNLLCVRADGWMLLDELCRQNLVAVVDEEGKWFRYNNLLCEFLNDRLLRIEGAQVERYHFQASQWLFEQGYFSEALDQAWKGKNFQHLGTMLDKAGGWRLILDGRFELLRQYFQHLPGDIVEQLPRLKLAEIFLLFKDGQFAHAQRLHDDLQQQLVKEYANDALLLCEAKIVGAYLFGYGDRPQTPEYLAFLKELKMSLPPSDRLLLADIENNLTYAHYELGNFGEAADSARRSMSCFRAINSLYGETFIYIHLGIAYFAQGRLRDAEATWREGHVIAMENFGADSGIAALIAVHLAMVKYETDHIDEARAYIEQSIGQLEVSECWCNVYIVGYLTAANINRIAGGTDGALKILERAINTARARELPRLELFVNIQKINEYARAGATEVAQNLADDIGLLDIYKGLSVDVSVSVDASADGSANIVSTRSVREAAGIALARLYFMNGDYSQAIALLDELAEEMRRTGHYIKLIETLVLKAVTEYMKEDSIQALATIDAIFSLVIFEGNMRVFLNEGVYMHNLLGLARRQLEFQSSNDPKCEFLTRLLKAFKQQEKGSASIVSDQRLTHRENELALLLIQGLLNKQIAARLNISENTVKYHLKQLYKKLGVNTRKDAILTISEHKLIGR